MKVMADNDKAYFARRIPLTDDQNGYAYKPLSITQIHLIEDNFQTFLHLRGYSTEAY